MFKKWLILFLILFQQMVYAAESGPLEQLAEN